MIESEKTNRILIDEEKENFNLFLKQYYLASANAIQFIAPILLVVFLVIALIAYFVSEDYYYTIFTILGFFIFFKLKSMKVSAPNPDELEVFEENGEFSTISNAGHRVMFNNYHAYNIDINKLQQNGLYKQKNVKTEYVILRADRKMIYVLNINGISDISLPVRR